MQLQTDECLRRFLQHILPRGFMGIRHYGWLANACRAQKLAQIKSAIAEEETHTKNSQVAQEQAESAIIWPFPCCKTSRMSVCDRIPPMRLEGG